MYPANWEMMPSSEMSTFILLTMSFQRSISSGLKPVFSIRIFISLPGRYSRVSMVLCMSQPAMMLV